MQLATFTPHLSIYSLTSVFITPLSNTFCVPGSLHLQHLVKMSRMQPWRSLVKEGDTLLHNYTCKMCVEWEGWHMGSQRKCTLLGGGWILKDVSVPLIPLCFYTLLLPAWSLKCLPLTTWIKHRLRGLVGGHTVGLLFRRVCKSDSCWAQFLSQPVHILKNVSFNPVSEHIFAKTVHWCLVDSWDINMIFLQPFYLRSLNLPVLPSPSVHATVVLPSSSFLKRLP